VRKKEEGRRKMGAAGVLGALAVIGVAVVAAACGGERW
jgi:hypothetical protein